MSDGRTMTDAEVVAKRADELQALADEFSVLALLAPGLKDRAEKLSRVARSLRGVAGRLRAADGGE